MRFTAFALFTLVASINTAFAQMLYAPPIDADAAFVRVVDVDPARDMQLSGKKIVVSEDDVSDYTVIESDHVNLQYGQTEETRYLSPKGYYTAILTPNELFWFQDAESTNPVKGKLAFYNVTKKSDVSLSAPAYDTQLFSGLKPKAMYAEDMNAVTTEFIAKSSGTEMARRQVTLERRAVSSVFLIEDAGSYRMIVHQGQLAK